MTGSRHHLRKQTLRVTLASEEQALALQPRLSDFNRRRLLAIIEKVFDAVDVPGLHLRLDRLDVDLGTVPFDDFERVVEERLSLRLQEAVEQAVRERRSSTQAEDRPRTEEELRLELLEHYLLHGTLPFWAPHGVAFSFGALFAELARSSPASLVRLVGKHATLGRVLDRLVLQLDQRQLEQLVMLLEPKHAALLIDYIVSLQALHRIEPVLPLSDRALSRLLWSLTLTYLVKDAGSQFNRKSALKLLLEGVSESQGLDYPELLTTLDSGLEQVRKRHPVLASLSSVIGELVRELPLPEVEEVETPVLDEELATTESASARYELAEALRYYLRHGELPWATLVRMPELTAERVVATLPELPRSLQRRALGWEQSGGSLARLVRAVRRIPEEVLSKLLVRLMPRPGDEGSPLRSALPVFAARAEDKPLFFARLLAALLDGKPVVLEELSATRVPGGTEDWGVRDADLSRWEAHALKSALVSRLRFGTKAGPTVEELLGALLTSFPEDSRHFLLALRDTEDLRTVLVDRSGEDVLGRAMDLLRPRESRSMRALLRAMSELPERVLPGGIEGARQTVFHELLLLGETAPLSRSTVSRLLRRLFGAEMPLEAQGFLSRVIADWGASGGVLQKHAEVFGAALDHLRERGGTSPSGDVDGPLREAPRDEDGDVRWRAGERAPPVHAATSSRTPDGIRTDHGDSAPRVQIVESGTHSHSVALWRDAASFDRGDASSLGKSSVSVHHAPHGQDEAAFNQGGPTSREEDTVPLGLGHAASRRQDRDSVAQGAPAANEQAEEGLDHGDSASREHGKVPIGHESDSHERAGSSDSRSDAPSRPGDAAAIGHESESHERTGASGDTPSLAGDEASLGHESDSYERTGRSRSRNDAPSLLSDAASPGHDVSGSRAYLSCSDADSLARDEASLSHDSSDSRGLAGTSPSYTDAASRAQSGVPLHVEGADSGGRAGPLLSHTDAASRVPSGVPLRFEGADSSGRAGPLLSHTDAASRAQSGVPLHFEGADSGGRAGPLPSHTDAASRAPSGVPLHFEGADSGGRAGPLPSHTDAASQAPSGVPLHFEGAAPGGRAGTPLSHTDAASQAPSGVPLRFEGEDSGGRAGASLSRTDSVSRTQVAPAPGDDSVRSHEQTQELLSRSDSVPHAHDEAPFGHDDPSSHERTQELLRRSEASARARTDALDVHSDSVPPARDSAPFSNDGASRHAQSEVPSSLSALDARVSDSAPPNVDTGGAAHSGPATHPTVHHTDAPPPAAHASLPTEHFAHGHTDAIAATVKHVHHERGDLHARDTQPSDTAPRAGARPLQPGDTSSRAESAPLHRPTASQASGHRPSTARVAHPLDVPRSPSESAPLPPRAGTHDSPEAREALFAFLLAESADRYAGLSDDALLRLLQSLLDESPDVLHGFIRRHVHRRHLQEHWARILPDPLLARIAAVLAPRLHTALLSTVEILIAAWQDVAPSDVPSLTERSAFWRFVLELLGRRPGASLGLEQLIAAFLEHFSTRLRGAHPTHRDSRGVAERLLERAIELAHHESLPRLASVLRQRRSTFLAAWTTPPRPPARATKPSRQRTSFQLGADEHGANDGNPIYIENAGLILTSPFLPHLFRELGLTHVDDQGKTRLDPEPATRAVHLLQYLVDGRTSAPEPLLVLNKILCGLSVPTPIPSGIEMTPQEQSLCDRLLKALIANWAILSGTSVAGLRETFLQREGRLEQLEDRWKLQVQRKTLDVLVDQVPWSLSILTYPWMPQPLYVSW
ncbi:contractile injection system tape measure protein [Myxococcus sp. MISCRS1]|uniref:contractile injection system tape measure protein n=1 Tax=Myxococcus sp. MISCRS1 TaxID=2996786 RepID=UPI00226DA767|nr:contractile injection system tape measure protein [Myxococcus sp. MISCRS1]MCY1001157.1 contractile injection system tape measure protein [Myxococcus sp. MISCRS1]